MLAKSAHFLEMYISLHVIVTATSVTSASSAFFTFAALMTELTTSDKHIYLCMFNKCWCMLNHHDQKIWCCRCVHHLSVVTIHMCRVLIERACKCEHCFEEKHNYVMNLVSRLLQLMMHHAAWTITQHFITHAWDHLALRLQQWKSE